MHVELSEFGKGSTGIESGKQFFTGRNKRMSEQLYGHRISESICARRIK